MITDSTTGNYSRSSKHLSKFYIVALSIIAFLAISGQLVIQYALHKQQQDAYTINMAGRQRMLSQKICKLILLVEQAPDATVRQIHTQKLHKALNTWEAFHWGLKDGNEQLGFSSKNSKKVTKLFEDINPYFLKISDGTQKILVLANQPTIPQKLKNLADTTLSYEGAFLNGMDDIVNQYQIESTEKVEFIKRLEYCFLAITLILLFLEGIFIFRPAMIKIKNTISQLKHTQRELQESNIKLEERVKERTRQINEMNVALNLNNEKLNKKNADLDTFVFAASHDLKAPLSNIEGLLAMLAQSKSEPEKEEIFRMITGSVERFKDILKDLADTGKEQNENKGEVPKNKFIDIFSEINFSIRELIKTSNARIYTDFSGAPEIQLSKKNIRSILYNLISNAIKYCHQDRNPEVHISTKKLGSYIILEVRDNGLGIKPEDKDNVFYMYKRLNTNHAEGTGVGLGIVSRIVQTNGGKIEVNSTPGQGSTIRLFMKIEEEFTTS